MMKLEIGSKVRVTGNNIGSGHEYHYFDIGDICEVLEVGRTTCCLENITDPHKCRQTLFLEDVEIVEDDEPLKVGDIVRVRQWDDMVEEYGLDHDGDINVPRSFVEVMRIYCGQVVTISKVVDNNTYEIVEDNGKWWYSREMFEEVTNDEEIVETYPELKNGQVVKIRGDYGLFIVIKDASLSRNNNIDMIIERETGHHLNLNEYLEDLRDGDGYHEFDIVEIYDLSYTGKFFDTSLTDEDVLKNSTLVWERNEKYVEVIDNGQQYSSYVGFLEDNFPKYVDKFQMNHDVENGTTCKVLGHAPHEWKHDELYVIENDEGQVFIVGEDGLRFLY